MVTINFVGDIMMGDSAFKLGIGVGSALFIKGHSFIFNQMSSVLRRADINVGNLECVFSKDKINPNNNFSPYMVYSTEHIKCLQDANFKVLNMANNHTMQYGSDIFKHTEDLLITNDIKSVGTCNNPNCIYEAHGIKFAFLGYSFRPNQFKNKDIQYMEGEREKVLMDVRTLSKLNDHVIVLFHWGDEFIDYPSFKQVDLAHDVIDAGGRVVIGHHPHILQGIEEYRDGIIAYSLGNFVFDKPQKLQRKSLLLQVDFSKDKLEKTHAIPVWINDHYQPEEVRGEKKKDIEELMDKLNKNIHNAKKEDQKQYDKDVLRGLYRMRIQFYIFFLMNFYRYRPKIILTLIRDAIMRRLHNKRNE